MMVVLQEGLGFHGKPDKCYEVLKNVYMERKGRPSRDLTL